jgi:CubicO group peptidase (beta-lactamase class C family)
MRKRRSFVLALSLAVLGACQVVDETTRQPYSYRQPQEHGDGWQTSSCSAQSIDPSPLAEMVNRVHDEVFRNIHSVLVVRNEKLVLEEYFPGYDLLGPYTEFEWNVRHLLCSATKSFASALAGIARDQGLLGEVTTPISVFYPEYADIGWSGARGRITLEHVLTMSAGFEWDESSVSYLDPRNPCSIMWASADPVRYLLSRPMAAEPGSVFVYNSGLSTTLADIARKVSGLPADQFALHYLFTPLGIQDFSWAKHAGGTVDAGGGLYLRPRDMAKFGQLYLNGGTWKGIPVVSSEWVAESTRKRIWADDRIRHYGFQWWIEEHLWQGSVVTSFAARGWGGQRIYVFPGLQLVVVFTGGNHHTYANPEHAMLAQHILPAVH